MGKRVKVTEFKNKINALVHIDPNNNLIKE